MDWDNFRFVLQPPGLEEIFVPLYEPPIALRAKRDTTIAKGHMIRVAVSGGKVMKNGTWTVERVFITSGELNLACSVYEHPEPAAEVSLLVCNWGVEDIHVAKGGLLAQAFAISEIKEIKTETESSIPDFSQFEEAMALYQKLQQNDAKTVYASLESYEEFFNDTKINKEDVSFAKIGPEWPKRIENQLREFLRNWVNVFASNPASPNAYHGPKFSIPTGDAIPTKDVPRRMSPGKEIKVRKHVDLMLQKSTSLIPHGLLR